jgi:hypothetical protein
MKEQMKRKPRRRCAQMLLEALEARALLSVKFQFDYSLDTNGFFNDTSRRATLQAAADSLTSRVGDTLNAIGPAGSNLWQMFILHPGSGSGYVLNAPTVPADVIRIYAGGRPVGGFASGRQANGVPGAEQFTSVTTEFRHSVVSRGEPGVLVGYDDPWPKATDVAPSIGAISFNSAANWHFGTTTSGLDSTKYDFHSAAVHELARLLGFGGANSWQRLVSNGKFTGTAAGKVYGASVPLGTVAFPGDHWAEGVTSGGQEAAMDPTLKLGTRKNFTPLDFAGLDDIGWELLPTSGGSTGSIAGSVFNDLDADGVRDAGEGALTNVRVFVDADNDSIFDATEKGALSDASGNYKISGLAAGTHRVRQVKPNGYRIVSPIAGYHTVTLAAGQPVTAKNFADTQKALISGTVYNDLDGDGVKDVGEAGVANTRVFVDADKDGVFDSTEKSTLTDSAGNYSFKTLSAGSYRIRANVASGWRRTTPSSGYYDFTLSSGGVASAKNFGMTQKVLISGNVFNDADGDRVRDTGESALASWRVFIDADADGVFDSTERSALSDAAGNWSFKNLAAGTYRIRIVQQSGWTRTTPASGYHLLTLSSGQARTGLLFGERRVV